jgi:hypothetical protein
MNKSAKLSIDDAIVSLGPLDEKSLSQTQNFEGKNKHGSSYTSNEKE